MTAVNVHSMYSPGSCALVERGLMCGKPIVTRGKCRMHWARVQRHGNPFTVKNNSGGTPLERFMRTTKRNDEGCLAFTGTPRGDGYGAFWTSDAGVVLAHRWIWEHTNGPISDGMTLDHLCHNEAAARGECPGGDDCPHRACVDLDHLAVKSAGDNALASANHYGNHTHCKRGHEFTPENTYEVKTAGRACRACHLAHETARQERLRTMPVSARPAKGTGTAATHCKNGHEFTEDNTRIDVRAGGYEVRVCRACQRDRSEAGRDKYNANRRAKRNSPKGVDNK